MPLDPDPDSESGSGSGSTDPNESGSGSGSTSLVRGIYTKSAEDIGKNTYLSISAISWISASQVEGLKVYLKEAFFFNSWDHKIVKNLFNDLPTHLYKLMLTIDRLN